MSRRAARARRVEGQFIPPMLLQPTTALPSGDAWLYELKLDGYRAIAFRHGKAVRLRSRNDNDFNLRYPAVVAALAALPDDTVIDGEVVAFDAEGRPSFNALQNSGSSAAAVVYYVFDVMVLDGVDVTREPLDARRQMLEARLLPALPEPVRYAAPLEAELPLLLQSVKAHGFEGLVGKRRSSPYEPGLRSGAWMKMRVNRARPFVIGGYTRGARTFDAVIVGCYEGDRLIYVARTRNGFTPASRAALFAAFKGLETPECPFANLPEARGGRWGEGLTKAKMAECRWLRPVLVGQFAFLEWTADDHLRHSKFVALRTDVRAREVGRETS
jgi:DNA ligase D-like protein (predicted ligase)